MSKLNFLFFILLMPCYLAAQTVTLEGYVFEENNRGYLNLAEITVLNEESKAIKGNTVTDKSGKFVLELPTGATYIIRVKKDLFEVNESIVSAVGMQADGKLYAKVEMKRKPGYIFDVTIAEKRSSEDVVVDAVEGARIEIYNNTKDKEALNLVDYPSPAFQFTFEQGNHYTIMIRKEGFFTKRMEAYVNVEGCILCFEGIGNVEPGVTDNLTEGHQMGTLLANVELIPVKMNESIAIDNIYYETSKWNIGKDATRELDKLIVILKDNPAVLVELGSHTDARGKDAFNMTLSKKRARTAVDYIIEKGVDASRIQAKGYGETALVNNCKNDVNCADAKHRENRRTTLKIIGLSGYDPMANMSLVEIIEAEKFEEMLAEVQNQEVIKVEDGQAPPDFVGAGKKNSGKMTVKDIEEAEPVREVVVVREPEIVEEVVIETAKPRVVEPQIETKIERPIERRPANTPARMENHGSSDFIRASARNQTRKNSRIVREYELTPNLNHLAPKQIQPGFGGYSIEILTADAALPLTHELFQKHGRLFLDERGGGGVAYLLGTFRSADQAESFLQKILLERYPAAKVVGFDQGRRR